MKILYPKDKSHRIEKKHEGKQPPDTKRRLPCIAGPPWLQCLFFSRGRELGNSWQLYAVAEGPSTVQYDYSIQGNLKLHLLAALKIAKKIAITMYWCRIHIQGAVFFSFLM
jgi:hypothetical protein